MTIEAKITNIELDYEFECPECHKEHSWSHETTPLLEHVADGIVHFDCPCGNLYIAEANITVDIRMVGK